MAEKKEEESSTILFIRLVYAIGTYMYIHLNLVTYLIKYVVCGRFLTGLNPCTSKLADDHRYYEINVKPVTINSGDIDEQIYDDPDSHSYVSMTTT